MANKGTIKSDQPTPILYPSEEKETRMAIRREDWNRMKREANSIRPEPKFLRTAYAAFFGVAVTAVFTIISIYDIPQKSSWILPFYICSAVFSLALAIILFCVDKYNTKSKSTDIRLLRRDMQDIEDTFKEETGEEIEEEGIASSKSLTLEAAVKAAMDASKGF